MNNEHCYSKMTKEQRETADEIIDNYRGTCDSLQMDDQEVLESLPGGIELLDDEIYHCPQCGWWVDASDAGIETEDGEELDEPICSNCMEDRE